MAQIVRHDIPATGGDSDFENQIVVGIWQGWPPEEENFLQVSESNKVVEERFDLVGRPVQTMLWA